MIKKAQEGGNIFELYQAEVLPHIHHILYDMMLSFIDIIFLIERLQNSMSA
jgi:hypothetical protein